ncbi:MAG: response regulator [Bacteroidia bacterium]|nr:response regulator [Bacteroidia bacterium]
MKNKSLVILIVEDSLQIVERMIPVLGSIENVRLVIHAANYAESIKMIGEMNANVVILDINLPDKSGIEMLKEIKKNHTGLKVIMLTNHATENYKRLCSRLGADYFLDKTIDFEKIPQTISSLN